MLSFKPIKGTDLQIIFDLEKRVLINEYDYAFSSIEELKGFLKGKQAFLIFDNKEFVGYFAYNQINQDEAEIATIIIDQKKQGNGYGKQVVDKCIDDLSRFQRIKIVTDPRNLAALILYLKKGFIISDYKKDYYGKDLDRVIMYKDKKLVA